MSEPSFTNREIEKKLQEQNEDLKAFMTGLIVPLTIQVTKTNGRVTKQERSLLIVACVGGTVLVLKSPEVLNLIKLFL